MLQSLDTAKHSLFACLLIQPELETWVVLCLQQHVGKLVGVFGGMCAW